MHYKYIYIKSYRGFYQGEEILLSDMHQITPEVNIWTNITKRFDKPKFDGKVMLL